MLELSASELIVDCRLSLSEGPAWDARDGVLYWASILDGEVHGYSPSTGQSSCWDIGQYVGAVVPRRRGGLMLAVRDGFGTLDPTTGAFQLQAPVELDRTDQRMNDGGVDSDGRFWAGTMSAGDPVQGSGSLYRLDSDGSTTTMLGGLTISNGIGWSPDDRYMYFVDSPTRRIDRFDFDADIGTIANRTTIVEIEVGAGSADGLAVDADGCIWVAVWGSSQVRRYSPAGECIASLTLPVTCPSSCAFGGQDWSTLFVTTARLSLTPEEQEREIVAGGIFAADVGVSGIPIALCEA